MLNKAIDLLYLAKQNKIEIGLHEDQLQLKLPKGGQVNKNLLQEIKDNKELIIDFLRGNTRNTNTQNITRFDRNTVARIPLSFSQERLWFIDRLEGTLQYHVPAVLRMKGTMNKEALENALQQIINRHEVLRTNIREEDGQGYQFIRDKDNWNLTLIDGAAYKDDSSKLQQTYRQLVKAPFDLSKDYMLRADLIRLDENDHVLVTTVHHIASDGWSTSIIVKELVELYTAFVEGRPAALPSLPIQYADYAFWQRNQFQGVALENMTKYWKEKLQGVSNLRLPTDFPRPAVHSTSGARTRFNIDKELSEQLKTFSQQQGTTIFMTLLAGFKIMLHRYSGQQDICVGTPIAGRQQQELEGLIGFFINSLALRSNISDDLSFIELLQQVKAITLEAYANQQLPFEKVVEIVGNERDISRNPLFQVLFTMQNTPETPELRLGEMILSAEGHESATAQLDIICNITETPNGFHAGVDYCTDLFTESTIRRMMMHFKQLLAAIVKAPHQAIGSLPMLSPGEQSQLLAEFNNTKVEYAHQQTVISLFEEQVAKTPDNISVVFDAEQLTYRQLNERANQLARYLKSNGVKSEQLIPICIERSLEMLVVILGILKAGAAYVPVDPEYPSERINYLLEDTAASLVITNSNSIGKLPADPAIRIVLIDEHWELISSHASDNLQVDIALHQLAYVIYTSGSTGKPKGVMIEHSNLCSYLLNNKTKYISNDASPSGSFVHLSYTFDASLTGLFMPLLHGKSVVIGSKKSVDVFEDGNLQKHAPYDFIKITPSHLELLLPKIRMQGGALLTKKLVIGGEALLLSQLNYLAEAGLNVTIINEYGPTEATVGCSIFSFDIMGDSESMPKTNSISIGKPIDNVQLYILGENNELLPIGVAGELCIGGDGLARGYLNRKDLTADKFIKNPFGSMEESRLYKTGDLASWTADGNITYLGRKDEQVKIRGHRVELGEIESVLQECASVRQAAVLTKDSKEGSKQLVAYVVPADEFDKEELIGFLQSRLPEYMVPALWIELESIPLTINGKIDRKALPDPDVSAQLIKQYVAPKNDLEKALAGIWQDVLEVDQVGVEDDFFDLGGHSLLAIRLISAIRKASKVEMEISDIFNYPTIALMAKQVEKQSGKTVLPSIAVQTPRPEHIPLSFSQERLWFIDQLEGSIPYHIPAILRLKGQLNKEALHYALQQIINRHEVLRTVIREEEGRAYQFINNKDEWQLNCEDGTQFNQNAEAWQQHTRQLINKPFDLAKDYMLRANLVRLADTEHVLVVTLHHIASDAWSASIIVKELLELWKAYEEGRDAALAIIPLQYADFSIWQRNYLQGELLENKLAFWKNNLQGVEPLELPTDYARPLVQSTKGAFTRFYIDKEIAVGLQRLSQQEGASLFMTLLAAFKVLLFRYSGQQDICVGTPIAGRQQQELEGLIGFFINTLALRSELTDTISFKELLHQVRANTLAAYEHQDVPFEKVVEAVVKERELSRSPLFQVMFILQNTPPVDDLRLGKLELTRESSEHDTTKFELTFSMVESANGLNGAVEYCTDLYSEETIQQMVTHFKELLHQIVQQPLQSISSLPMLTREEKHCLVVDFNETHTAVPSGKSIIDLFEEQVAKNPAKVAIVFEATEITYRQLHQQSSQLADYLMRKGVKKETLVPICIERSIEMIVGIMGILKAGAAYVPIDPGYPLERISYILKDTAAELVLTSSNTISKLPAIENLQCISLDSNWPLISKQETVTVQTEIDPGQLAYIIYTSGSTGKPKGVLIEHSSLLNYLLNNQTKYITDEAGNAGSFIHLSYTFDASVTGIFMPLLSGKTIVVASGQAMDLFEDPNLLKYAPYDFIKITPAHIELLEHTIQRGNTNWITGKLVIGGEALHQGHFSSFVAKGVNVEVINEYGPTESSVGCSTYSFHTLANNDQFKNGIPIGKPIDNIQLYVLDKGNQLVPKGVVGELCIGGAGLSRGYLNLPGLTAEKFINNPFGEATGSRLYKTGDLARWLPDGNLEYLGRIDDQVKIRGYRIELGEIESVLQESGLVKQAVVLAKKNSEGIKRLIGYVVAGEGYTREAITAYLHNRMPEYMVPQLFMELDSLPLTTNGKVNKKALPDVDANKLISNEYAAPRNEVEKYLAEVWQKLLGIERAGINDNFFELGGDSILTIQVVSRMRRHGYELRAKDIFIHQTISRLSVAITERSQLEASGEQGMLRGLSGLLPIQQWYLEKNTAAISHYNQAILLGIKKSVSETTLTKVIEQLTRQHDALRFSYKKMDEGWQQEYTISSGVVVTENLQMATTETMAALIKENADRHQRLLDIEKGELVRVVLMQTPATESHNRLLLVIHHLAIDGVSWRIILEDLEQLLNTISEGQEPVPGQKGSSYRQWYQALEQYGKTRGLLSQKGYWQNTIESYQPLPVDKAHEGTVRAAELGRYTIKLNAEQTRRLLQEVPRAYHTEINDILLCALGGTVCEWAESTKVVIGLEGHGREAINEDVDTSRTVGWFTTIYPLLLETVTGGEVGEQIKSVKEQLRKVPARGIGYGVLKFINREAALSGGAAWDIVFNYLGQFDNVVNESNWMVGAAESSGAGISETWEIDEKLSVNGSVQSGELVLNWGYSSVHYEPATINGLAEAFLSRLEDLIAHCLKQQQSGEVFTPSDYGLGAEISYSELDAFLEEPFNDKKRKNQVEGIYRLSGLQQGMLFHGLYDDRAGAYTEQFNADLVNANLDHLTKSWQQVLNNHSILRSGFYSDVFSVPVQCVYREVTLPVEVLDFTNITDEEQVAAINEYEAADRAKGFDFRSAPLMRISLLKLSKDRYRMIWTFHHILFDGWSLPVLMEEFLSTYELLVAGSPVKAQEEDKYEDYIRYIERSDQEAEENHWRKYMLGVEQPTLLPFIGTTTERTKGAGSYNTLPLQLDATLTEKIQSYAQQHRLTVNTLMQGVWSLLLHRYTGNKDIVYGVIVSGRPDDLPNVEKRVGLFINTLPLHSIMEEGQKVADWLQLLQTQQVSSRQYQYTPLHEIQRWAGVPADLFDSLLIFENYPVSEIIGSRKWSLEIENVQMQEQTNYPLSIIISSAEKINIGFNYNTALLEEIYVDEIKDHFENVLKQLVITDAASRLQDIDPMTLPERQRLLVEFNQTEVHYPRDKSIVDLFEEQVLKTPAAIALVFGDEKLSYRELNERANHLAHYLRAKGVKEETLVPICMERSPRMIIGIMGILKAGGAYVPIDAEYPAERITYMLEDTVATIVLTSKITREKLPSAVTPGIIELDGDWSLISKGPAVNLQSPVFPNQLAYVIYTSGSTGKPKGVMIEHRGVINLAANQCRVLQIKEGTSYLQFASFGFDASCFEIFSTILNGGKLVLCTKDDLLSAPNFENLVNRNSIEIAVLPPSFQHEMKDSLGSIKTIVSAGEPLNVVTGKYLQSKGIRVINAYGPTENTVCATMSDEPVLENDTVVIGKPIDNVQVYVLNEQRQLVPVGVTGELCLAGAGLARGYLNRKDLTAEKFISNPFSKDPSSIIYTTGDLVRQLPDGNIEYLGRKDDQVKIRGYRIELGEIETVLLQSGLVSQVIVIASHDTSGNKRLVGYVVSETSFDKQLAIAYLHDQLPEYMVPALWVQLDRFPLTPSGKIDKKALPDAGQQDLAQEGYIAPRNELEEQLAVIWKELLNVERVGINDNFFELGGHSLLAMRMVSVVRKNLQIEIAIKTVFNHSTIAALAATLGAPDQALLLAQIEAQPRPSHIPLSFSQERLWFIDQLEGSQQYHIPAVLRLQGVVNSDALEYAIASVINRHEVLRTIYLEQDGDAYQLIKNEADWKLPVTNGSSYKDDPPALQDLVQQLVSKPFDLSIDNMLRADLLTISDHEHILVVTMHHIASDGWSIGILVKEVAELYNAYKEQREAILAPLAIQYADFAIWQRNTLQGPLLDTRLNYWLEKLKGVEPLQMLTDFPRPAIQTNRGAQTGFSFDKELTASLQQLSHQQGSTLFMTLLAAFKILLHRYSSGQKDICVGTAIAGRQQQELEGLIGFFINTLALRSEINPEESFATLLQQVRKTTLDAYENQEVPFEKVVDGVIRQRDRSRNPVFQVMFVLQNTPEVPTLQLGELQLSMQGTEHTTAQFDISVSITEHDHGLVGSLEYNADLYKKETIHRMFAHFRQLVISIVNEPKKKISALNILSIAEEQHLLFDLNANTTAWPTGKTIIDLFEEQVAADPQAIAVVFEAEKFTYRQLNEKANQLAYYLQAKGVKKETLVAISIERSLEMIVGILGVLKAGGAYVPIDTEYPAERMQFMLEDTAVNILLTSDNIRPNLPVNNRLNIISLDGDWDEIAIQPTEDIKTPINANNLAYIIYTSGSTGKPKGVMIEHSGVVNLALSQAADLRLKPQMKTLQFASFGFDASCYEIFNTLLSGGNLVLPKKEDLLSAEKFEALVNKHGVEVAVFPPSFLLVIKDSFGTIKTLVSAGEALTAGIAKHIQSKGIRLINAYGPTENTVCTTLSDDTVKENDVVVIGNPISNVQVYILDKTNNLCPTGVMGELCIGGPQLARGYLNRAELTAEKFIDHPFSKEAGSKIYKTGDLGRWLADGNIEYLGRKDDQVKIRGYRIEPGEIEMAVRQSDLVSQAVVIPWQNKEGNKSLVGYIVPSTFYNKNALVTYLQANLPDYMIPALWVELEQLPLTSNGKIDKKALPDPGTSDMLSNQYVAPGTEAENKLVTIWQDILQAERIGIHDNFFELGGHSLLAMRLISAVRKGLNADLSVKELFLYPTIAELGAYLYEQKKASSLPAIQAYNRPPKIPLSFSQERLWFIDQLEGSVAYNSATVLRLKGKLNQGALSFALQNIISRHEALRTVFHEAEGKPFQRVIDKDGWNMSFVDGDAYREDRLGLQKFIEKLISIPFNLEKDYMLRADLIMLEKDNFVLVVTMHHIASDGWSLPIVVKEVVESYNAFSEGRTVELDPLPLQYADYSIWQHKYLEGAVLDKKIGYWKKKLNGVTALQLTTDYNRPAIKTVRGASVHLMIEKELSDQLNQLSQQQGTTLFMTLLATYNILLNRYSGQQDICVGTSIANRPQEELEGLIGFFVNTLALRNEVVETVTFTALLQQVKTTTLEAYENQDVPFERVVEEVGKDRDVSRSPLFQVMLVLLNLPGSSKLGVGEIELSVEAIENKISKFEFTFHVSQSNNGLSVLIAYNTDLYREDTIIRMAGHFKQLLNAVVKEPGQTIDSLQMLTEAEEQQLLVEFN